MIGRMLGLAGAAMCFASGNPLLCLVGVGVGLAAISPRDTRNSPSGTHVSSSIGTRSVRSLSVRLQPRLLPRPFLQVHRHPVLHAHPLMHHPHHLHRPGCGHRCC